MVVNRKQNKMFHSKNQRIATPFFATFSFITTKMYSKAFVVAKRKRIEITFNIIPNSGNNGGYGNIAFHKSTIEDSTQYIRMYSSSNGVSEDI
jgi:protoheme ferro-lyase